MTELKRFIADLIFSITVAGWDKERIVEHLLLEQARRLTPEQLRVYQQIGYAGTVAERIAYALGADLEEVAATITELVELGLIRYHPVMAGEATTYVIARRRAGDWVSFGLVEKKADNE